MLDDALRKFQSTKLADPSPGEAAKFREDDRWIPSLATEYVLFPDAERALLGKGGYGAAYKVKSVKHPKEPVRVVKVIVKNRVISNALQIQHMCAELAVSGLINDSHLNHRSLRLPGPPNSRRAALRGLAPAAQGGSGRGSAAAGCGGRSARPYLFLDSRLLPVID